jgi:hypothetical protein
VPCSAGWGGPGGYVYQKAYLAKELVLILIIELKTYHCNLKVVLLVMVNSTYLFF